MVKSKSIMLMALMLVVLLAAPAAAQANANQESLFQDDTALVFSGANTRARTLDELQRLGVDSIRVNLIWNRAAPSPYGTHKPRFDDQDPASYDWSAYDAFVGAASARHFNVMFTVTGPVPAWASRCGGSLKRRGVCKPNAGWFGHFAQAAGRHFTTVRRWSVWNEPNQAGWLYPQWSRYKGRYRPYAPGLYRSLAYAAIGGLRHSGHSGDRILLGETAPIGRHTGSWAKRSMSPADFIAGVFCIDSRGRRLRGADASAQGCHRHFRRMQVTGFAHHPYTRGAAADPRSRVAPGDITLSSLGRLSTVLHRAARVHNAPRSLPVYLTEFGVQTNPPDRYSGVSLTRQAEWLNESDYMAYRSFARSVSQYELYDDPGVQAFQTGLRFRNGRGKPSLAAYRLPLWVVYAHGHTNVWGQVRPGGRGARVEVLYRPRLHRPFRLLANLVTRNARGFLTLRTSRPGAQWRLRWVSASGRTLAQSRTAVAR